VKLGQSVPPAWAWDTLSHSGKTECDFSLVAQVTGLTWKEEAQVTETPLLPRPAAPAVSILASLPSGAAYIRDEGESIPAR
jgi:hypothetical protein